MVGVEVVTVEDDAALLNGKNQVGLSKVIKGRYRNFRVGLVIERSSSFVTRRIEEEFVDHSCERQLRIKLKKGIEDGDGAGGFDVALFDGAHVGGVAILVEFTLPDSLPLLS